MQSFSKAHLPEGAWFMARKRVMTRMIEIQGPFIVSTIHTGDVTCEDGFLALDEKGYPYPIARDIFYKSYDAAGSVPGIGPRSIPLEPHYRGYEPPGDSGLMLVMITFMEDFLKNLKEVANVGRGRELSDTPGRGDRVSEDSGAGGGASET